MTPAEQRVLTAARNFVAVKAAAYPGTRWGQPDPGPRLPESAVHEAERELVAAVGALR